MARAEIRQAVTGAYEEELRKLKRLLEEADAVLVGAGAGLSAAAGLTYGGERFTRYFGDFIAKYGLTDMYSAGFFPFDTPEAKWAYWARFASLNRYGEIPKDTLRRLLGLLQGKDFFVLTTNVDHTFIREGFPKEKLFYTQGDFGLFQCAKPCHDKTYDNEDTLKAMLEAERDLKVPERLFPKCPVCGGPMSFNLFCDDTFVRDRGWREACRRYEAYVAAHRTGKVLYWELGVGFNSPGVIKLPFWQMAAANREAAFASVNLDTPCYPSFLDGRAVVISDDIDRVIRDLEEV